MDMPPPDFGELPYPSAGERIGPAWAGLWSGLADGHWRWRVELIAEYAPRFELAPATVQNLLIQAARCGALESRVRRGGPLGSSPRKRAQLRRRPADAS